jgi:hypothetical protein
MLREWIVTLYNHEDLDDFYDDMETPGGSLYIPDREVTVEKKRLISRNTHYMLTDEEAEAIKNDNRVRGVDLAELVNLTIQPSGYKIEDGIFAKDWGAGGPPYTSLTDLNWGLLRQSESSNRSNWGDNGTPELTSDLIITASGRNVDVVIFDGHIDPNHPEFTVNSDGSGGSRINQYNWFQNNIGFGTGTYTYTPYVDGSNAARTSDNDHGVHVGGTVAGNTQGWARDANIYNINPLGSNSNFGTLGLDSSTYWDYVRAWHNNKPINPVTGRKNPTITNHSYGSSITYNSDGFGPVTSVTFRGVTYSPGRALTVAELQARGFFTNDTSPGPIPYYFTSSISDFEDAINDGILTMSAAGNESWKIVNPSDQDYNNSFLATYNGSNFLWWLHRGNGMGAGIDSNITVGAVGVNVEDYKGNFSNCGSQVDIFAAGTAIQSSLHTVSGEQGSTVYDARNTTYYLGKYSGTSMACPQICGMLACLAEHWPNMTQAEATQWLVDFCNKNQMGDTGADNAMDVQSLQGAPNKFARWINQRPVNGGTYPRKNFRPRTVDDDPVHYGKRVYPRPRIRRRG